MAGKRGGRDVSENEEVLATGIGEKVGRGSYVGGTASDVNSIRKS